MGREPPKIHSASDLYKPTMPAKKTPIKPKADTIKPKPLKEEDPVKAQELAD